MGRNSRRQQRLKKEEEEEQLEEVEEHNTEIETKNHQNIFSSFIQSTTEQEEEQEEEEDDLNSTQAYPSSNKKKRKPKKKKKTSTQTSQNDDPTASKPPTTSTDKTNLKNKSESKVDEIDQALIELAQKLPKSINIGESSDTQRFSSEEDLLINNLLKIDTRNLDPDLELRKMFGARVISSTSSNTTPINQIYGPRISNNPHHHLNTKAKLKSTYLTKPHPHWPQLDRSNSGLSVRKLSRDEIESKKLAKPDEWYKFEHSIKFRFYQARFLKAVASSDPNLLIQILQKSPYHPDTLLQLSEVSAHNEDQLQAINFVNQALYLNEKILNFQSSSSSESNSKSMILGNFRLDYNSAENRNFFRSLDFKLKFLIKQGCYKTAFETCKLLFSLNPYQDPFGSLLWIDFLAVKSNQHQFFLEFLKYLPDLQRRDPNGGIIVEAYPGLHFAKAMCMRAIEEKTHASHEGSDSALESAILRFPQVIMPLAEMIGIHVPSKFEQIRRFNLPTAPIPSIIQHRAGTRFVDPQNLINLTSQIYVHRSFLLWKIPNLSNWLQSIIHRSLDKFDNVDLVDTRWGYAVATNPNLYFGSFESVYRSVIVSDVAALKKLLPQWVYSVPDNISFSFEPFPPSKGDMYDANYFKDITGQTHHVAVGEDARVIATREDDSDSDLEDDEIIRAEAREENEEGDEQEEVENGMIFSNEFDPTHLDQPIINRLISRIQSNLEINYDQLSVDQRHDLLNRLDALFIRQKELEDQPELNLPLPLSDPTSSDTEPQIDPEEPSFDHSHQMPGSFFN